ncbi:hypothetical protein OS175_14070 [Marinicella sp. S1101]|uniref:hypothetical protein n=1 Tax=Marinicella marina TaxID=2996016 RepID=UPI002260AD0C|nr:hypothetical protein [Marinicella marina]MCX7554999.1 hypothetical protein [Marinicella marina]MDJ1141337.1 hypothetical protein [Marinicella marina]
MFKLLMTLQISLLCWLTPAYAEGSLSPFKATYSISRDDKPTAQQTTTLSINDNNQYTLKDITKGTNGLASLTGFNRQETTEFNLANEQIIDITHRMKQKVAFAKKSYRFESKLNTISGKGKKPFTFNSTTKPISAHMLPLWISALVCQGQRFIEIDVLKSSQPKAYQFRVFDQDESLFRVERQYPASRQRSTHIWLDKNRHCFPVRTLHQVNGEPDIETKLKTVTFNLK